MFSRSSRRLLLPRLGLFAIGVILPVACAAGAPNSSSKPAADAPDTSAVAAALATAAAPATATVPAAASAKRVVRAKSASPTPAAAVF